MAAPPDPAFLLTVDEATRLLPYLTPAQLRAAVESALPASPSLLSSVRAAADTDYDLRRLYPRCITWETTPDVLNADAPPAPPAPLTADEATWLLPCLTLAQLRAIVESALRDSPPLLASLRAAAYADAGLRRLYISCITGAILKADVPPSPLPLLTADQATRLLPDLTLAQLRAVVASALPASSPLLASFRATADAAANLRCLYVRGFRDETSAQVLNAAFSNFGPVRYVRDDECLEMLNRAAIHFDHAASVVRALASPSKRIDGRITISYLPLRPRPIDNDAFLSRAVIVDRVPWSMDGDLLINYFQVFGEIALGPAGWFDTAREDDRPLRVVFLYQTVEGAQAATTVSEKMVGGISLRCRFADTKLLVHGDDTDDPAEDHRSETTVTDDVGVMREHIINWPEYQV